jgi:hypothetical protein
VLTALVAGAVRSIDRATAIGPTAAAKPGTPAPAFSAPDAAGMTVNLGDCAGKPVTVAATPAYSCSIKYNGE